ncbi:suppressor of fused domain protein [Schlesneria paludicola]|uniref:suppressor of fused domain protein n=1 Tax=Schlesneria paludicola TaxID=360056 RepID=UPI00029B0FCB|nr:suppressor of fused domain protein [Schlesneria paludicola]
MAIVFRCEKCDTRYRVNLDKAGCRATCRRCGQNIVVPDPMPRDQVLDLPTLQDQRQPSLPLPPADPARFKLVADHIEHHLGPIDYVFHELVSEYVHIDIHRIPPQKHRPWYTLVTSGMSERPMTVPDGAESLRFAELLICLPPHWPLSMEDFRDERNYWPIRLLKVLARLPHEFQTWLGLSHSIPNGEPPRPYAVNTKFCCSVLVPPLTCPDPFRTLQIDDDQTVQFYAVLPLFPEELDCKLRDGMNVLIDRLDSARVTEVVNIRRKNSCRKRWSLFG